MDDPCDNTPEFIRKPFGEEFQDEPRKTGPSTVIIILLLGVLGTISLVFALVTGML